MEVLTKAPECYIQQCVRCGAVLKYSKCDIHVADVPFFTEDGTQYRCSFDSIVCPSCDNPIEAERTWFIEVEWIKKLLDNIR